MTLPEDPQIAAVRAKNLAYRTELIACEQKAQTSFDRTVIALSGGALAISFAFIEKLIETGTPQSLSALKVAWVAWIASLACVLISHYFSALAMRRAIKQADMDKVWFGGHPGGGYEVAILILNAAGGLLFVVGAIAAGFFFTLKL